MEYIEKRLDELILGDIVLNANKEERYVGYINTCYGNTWYSISIGGGKNLEQILGHCFQVVPVKVRIE